MEKGKRHITIVGAGLVGSLLSIYLIKRGYKVSVYERRMDMRSHIMGAGRSINLALSNRGIRALEEVGLAKQLKENAMPMHGRMMHDINGKLTYQAYGKEGQFINSISRTGLNMVLMNEAEKLGVVFHFDHRCLEINLEKTEISFQHYGGIKHVQSDLIIGADGAFSAVRGSLQISDRFDYSQHYIEHGYKELRIPPGTNGEFLMKENALHIWPRESFMLIALPNPDATFTCTLFFPFEGETSFATLKTPGDFHSFFEKNFPDLKLPDSLDENGWWNHRPFEDEDQRQPRADKVLAELLSKHGDKEGQPEERIVFVSHGGFFVRFLSAVLQLPWRQGAHGLRSWFLLNNCSISRFDFRKD